MPLPPAVYHNDIMFDQMLGPTIIQGASTYFGVIFICLPLDGIFFGIMLCQLVHFLEGWKQEQPLTKALVATVVSLGTASTGFFWYWMWVCNVSDYGKPVNYLATRFYWPMLMMEAIVTLLCQLFFIKKAWLLWSKNWFVVVLPLLICLTQFGGGIGGCVFFGVKHVVMDPFKKLQQQQTEYVYFFCGFFVDLFITALILFQLKKSKTGWSTTDTLVQKLIWSSIESQVPPAIGAAAVAVQLLVDKKSAILTSFWICLGGKLYIYCLMFPLNGRTSLRKIKQASSRGTAGYPSFTSSFNKKSQVQVDVERVTATHSSMLPENRRHKGLRVDDEDTSSKGEVDIEAGYALDNISAGDKKHALGTVVVGTKERREFEGLPSGASASSKTTLVREDGTRSMW